jgi:hypothetical protein
MKLPITQMIVLGAVALFFTVYAPQNAAAQQGGAPLDSTDEMQSLVPEKSTLTPEEKMQLKVEEEYVFDEQVPG